MFRRVLFDKPLTPFRAARLIATASLMLTLAGGLSVWLLDRSGIPSFGDSLWWALQTVTTVGYGDVVPSGTTGKVIGALLMLNGIALLSVITAAITAMLVEQARKRNRTGFDHDVVASLERIETRLDQIEAKIAPPRD